MMGCLVNQVRNTQVMFPTNTAMHFFRHFIVAIFTTILKLGSYQNSLNLWVISKLYIDVFALGIVGSFS